MITRRNQDSIRRFEETSESADVHRSRADVPKERTREAESNNESLSFDYFLSTRKLPVARIIDLVYLD